MKTIVEALQDLYVAMGGEASDVSGLSLNPDVIEQIATLVQSGETKELPAVTASDNDKVLAVVNGQWDKAEASGGGGDNVMLVTITEYEEDGDYTYTADTNANDILKALASDKYVYAKCGDKYFNLYSSVGVADQPGVPKTIDFLRVFSSDNSIMLDTIRIERTYTSLTDYTDTVTRW